MRELGEREVDHGADGLGGITLAPMLDALLVLNSIQITFVSTVKVVKLKQTLLNEVGNSCRYQL